MRNKIFLNLVFLMLLSFVTWGQSFSPISQGSFQVSQGTVTSETLNIQGTIFQIYESRKYGKYIATLNRHNKLVPRWIGEKTTHYFNNVNIRLLRTGTYLIPRLNTLGKVEFQYLEKL